MHEATEIVHSQVPPCNCRDCLRATAQADQRRAEIDAILSRLDELDALAEAFEPFPKRNESTESA